MDLLEILSLRNLSLSFRGIYGCSHVLLWSLETHTILKNFKRRAWRWSTTKMFHKIQPSVGSKNVNSIWNSTPKHQSLTAEVPPLRQEGVSMDTLGGSLKVMLSQGWEVITSLSMFQALHYLPLFISSHKVLRYVTWWVFKIRYLAPGRLGF